MPLARVLAEREHSLRSAAHQLKTPLARLRVVTETASEDIPPETSAKLLGIVDQADRTTHLLLRAAELSARGIESREPLRLDLLVDVVLEDAAPLEAMTVIVVGNADWLRIAIETLLDNARKHGCGFARVVVDARGVLIEDAGPGFTAQELSASVAPFRRGAASRGTGLGLALATQIAEAHGGALERRNRENGGATMRLALDATACA